VLPSCIIVSLIAFFYFKYKELTIIQGVLGGLRPAVIALITSAGLSILTLSLWGQNGFSWNISDINFISVILFSTALWVLYKFKPNPIFVMLGTGVVGGVIYLIT